MSGTSRLVGNDRYVIYLHEPPGSLFKEFSCGDATLLENKRSGNIRTLTILADHTKTVSWEVRYY